MICSVCGKNLTTVDNISYAAVQITIDGPDAEMGKKFGGPYFPGTYDICTECYLRALGVLEPKPGLKLEPGPEEDTVIIIRRHREGLNGYFADKQDIVEDKVYLDEGGDGDSWRDVGHGFTEAEAVLELLEMEKTGKETTWNPEDFE